MIKYLEIYHDSIVDGEGLRSVLFTCGCPHKCKGCHNPESWDENNGNTITVNKAYIELASNPLTNITYSGGDPFQQCKPLIKLSRLLKENTNKTIWAYTGYTYEEIINDKLKFELLKYIDVLVDGKFILEQKELGLLFKGSKNQRIIDVQKSLKEGKVIEKIVD